MAHSKEAHGKMGAMKQFNEGHWEKKEMEPMVSDLKYTQGEMSNPEHLKSSVNALSGYVKKNRMKY
jgi:hypothetical protein